MELFDCRLVRKDRFVTEKGYQPKNSLFCILEGEFFFRSEGKTVQVGAGEVVFFPDNVYFEREMVVPISFYYARFSLSEGDPPYRGILVAPCRDRILEDFQMMERLSRLPAAQPTLADHYLTDVFISLNAEQLFETGENDPAVKRAIEYFRAHLREPISLYETARICGVSQSLLSMKFKRCLKCAPMSYLQFLRIERAKELLSERETPISEVAVLCGFDNPYYFSNAFYKKTGVRPKDYRKQLSI